ncbi:MAG: cysteine synthase A [Phascolarctobacterium sp.]|nr:cysteine synthase A [Phascolarctobacterium sp.]
MSGIAQRLTDLIGNTPLLALNNYGKELNLPANILAKLEYFNPAGSAKDRIAIAMIEVAEEAGLLKEGSTIIEPTSGNTGIGLASVAAAKGYQTILTMPDTMSVERRNLLKAYGAQLVLTPGELGMQGAIDKAVELAKLIEGAFIPGQFDNPANPKAHYETTGPEIWRDTEGKVDVLVAGVGTGGTLSGTAKFLKEQNPEIKVVAVEPDVSPVLQGGEAAPHKLQGIGANFVPKNYDASVVDEVLGITAEDAYKTCRLLAKHEGLLVGVSSGAAAYAATLLAQREEYKDKNIVVILPDSGERYLSTPGFVE